MDTFNLRARNLYDWCGLCPSLSHARNRKKRQLRSVLPTDYAKLRTAETIMFTQLPPTALGVSYLERPWLGAPSDLRHEP
jgi:hypothetical protein